jgi:pimeloyl-ACP methyl ester carboxylesterase
MKIALALASIVLLFGCGGPPGGGGGGGGGGGSSFACGTCNNTTPAQPVILVHGRNDTSARWDTLVSNWSSRGYTENVNLFRIDMASYCGDNGFCSMLGSPDGDGATYVNESYANCLKRYIDEKVPTGTVDIVAHSQGVVVSRYYARFLGSLRVDDLVMMSGPSNGIQNCTLAGACGGVNPEDCPDSAFMHKLNGVSPEGDGTNDETPGASATGPVQYDAVVSDKDTVISPWCTAHFALNPQTEQGDDYTCRGSSLPTVDPEAGSCKISAQHLVIPTDASAIEFAYCEINKS